MANLPSFFPCLLLLISVVMATPPGLSDQKNYYSPPSTLSPSLCNSHGHGHSPHGHTPPHGSYGGSPPSHSTPSPPSGGDCGSPPVEPTPTPYTPTPTPSTPSNPPSGGYYPPSTPTPSTPDTPVTPTPDTPVTPTPDTPVTPTPDTPTTPTSPSPPYTPDPNSPYSCNYWRTHPGLIWGLFGWWGTVGSAFGVTSLPGFGTSMSLQQALSNTRTDGYGTLYREGTASLLNSMVTHKFPYTTRNVRESFMAALGSNKAAAAQGEFFRQANEGKMKTRV